MSTSNMALHLWLVVFALTIVRPCVTVETAELEPELAKQLITNIESLKAYVRQQGVKIQDLETKVKQQETEIRILKETANRNKHESIIQGEKDTNSLEKTTSKQRVLSTSKLRKPMRVTRAVMVHVAFSAYLDHEEHHVDIDNIILFNRLLINDGSGYSASTGVFTSPVTGVYLFTYTVNTMVTAHQLVVKLVVDGVNISDGISDPMHGSQEIQGGNTVIVRVDQGQAVWLAAYNTANTLVDGRPDYRFSTFSGALLYT